MLARKEYIFPIPEVDGMKAVEEKYLEILHKVRDKEQVDDEELDYLDYANNVLMTVE